MGKIVVGTCECGNKIRMETDSLGKCRPPNKCELCTDDKQQDSAKQNFMDYMMKFIKEKGL